MTIAEFMKLERGDGVVIDGHTGTITKVTDYPQGSVMYEGGTKTTILHTQRELEISFFNEHTGKVEKQFPKIYTEGSDHEVHNRSVLKRLQIWDPLCGSV